MALSRGQLVSVARGGGLTGVVEEIRPGQVLVRFANGETTWVSDHQVTRKGLSLRPTPSHPSAGNPYAPPVAAVPGAAFQQSKDLSLKELLFSFEGRIGRRQYWNGTFMLLFSLIALGLFVALLVSTFDAPLVENPNPGEASAGSNSSGAAIFAGSVVLVFVLPYLWCSLAVSTKRWHDHDKSGWWNLLTFIPYLGGLLAFIFLGCMRGTVGPNRFGPDPV